MGRLNEVVLTGIVDEDKRELVRVSANGLAANVPLVSTNQVTGEIAVIGPRGELGIEPKLYPANGQIKWGSYGDSIANVSGYANFDLRQINAAAPGFGVERMGSWVGPLSNGLFRLSANCGISGDNTTQMLARESAGASATRKAIIDAAATGVQFLVNSMGINDIQTLSAVASQATVDGVVNTAVANIVTLLKKQRANGIWPVTTSLMGYNLTTATAGEIAVRQAASRQLNAVLGPIIVAANGELGSWVDVYSLVTDSNGAWRAGLDQGDGLHPGANGCKVIYTPVVAEMLRVAGVMNPAKYAYGPQVNIFANPDFSASAAGTATGLNIYTAVGTCMISVIALGRALTPFRVRIALPRAFKLPVAY